MVVVVIKIVVVSSLMLIFRMRTGNGEVQGGMKQGEVVTSERGRGWVTYVESYVTAEYWGFISLVHGVGRDVRKHARVRVPYRYCHRRQRA